MALHLKFEVEGNIGRCKTVRIPKLAVIQEVVNELREKLQSEGTQVGADFALFFPGALTTSPRYLDPSKTIQSIDFLDNGVRKVSCCDFGHIVSLPDESIRAVIVDWSAPAEEAIRDIGDKAKISNFLEYSLRKFRDGEVGPWIKSSFTLPEQWVGDNDTLALRKRFFSSDATVDTADPQELHQLYCQLRELVVAGTLPTKQDEAMELAGLMAQIDWGNFDPRKHTQGFIAEINRYLPKQYTKKHKKGEQEILSRYQRLVGMDRTVAKYRFVQLCRSLKFYGITFFEVQTKQDPKTKKAKPVLFGVTRDAFLFLDIKTHEVVRQFKFSQLRRYTPGQGSITLDFGDHTDDYMTLFTKDGELIVESITGYIDLALRRMKGASARENEDRDAEYASASRVAATFGLATVSQTVSTSPPIAFQEHATLDLSVPQGIATHSPSPVFRDVLQERFVQLMNGFIADFPRKPGTANKTKDPELLYWSIERVIKAERDLLRTGLDIADSLEFDVAAAIKVPSDMHESGRIVLDELIAALKELERQDFKYILTKIDPRPLLMSFMALLAQSMPDAVPSSDKHRIAAEMKSLRRYATDFDSELGAHVLDYSVKRLLESLGERVIQLGKRVQASLRTSNCDRETGEKLDSLEGLLAALDRQLKEDGPFLAMSLSSFEIIKCIDNIEGVALDLNTLCAVDKAQTRDASLLLSSLGALKSAVKSPTSMSQSLQMRHGRSAELVEYAITFSPSDVIECEGTALHEAISALIIQASSPQERKILRGIESQIRARHATPAHDSANLSSDHILQAGLDFKNSILQLVDSLQIDPVQEIERVVADAVVSIVSLTNAGEAKGSPMKKSAGARKMKRVSRQLESALWCCRLLEASYLIYNDPDDVIPRILKFDWDSTDGVGALDSSLETFMKLGGKLVEIAQGDSLRRVKGAEGAWREIDECSNKIKGLLRTLGFYLGQRRQMDIMASRTPIETKQLTVPIARKLLPVHADNHTEDSQGILSAAWDFSRAISVLTGVVSAPTAEHQPAIAGKTYLFEGLTSLPCIGPHFYRLSLCIDRICVSACDSITQDMLLRFTELGTKLSTLHHTVDEHATPDVRQTSECCIAANLLGNSALNTLVVHPDLSADCLALINATQAVYSELLLELGRNREKPLKTLRTNSLMENVAALEDGIAQAQTLSQKMLEHRQLLVD